MAHMQLGGGSIAQWGLVLEGVLLCAVYIVRDILGVCEDVADFVLYAIYCYLRYFFEDCVVDDFWSYVE
jgi:hypothetical protein